MFNEEIIKVFCAAKSVSIEDAKSQKRELTLWHTRYMIWYYLHYHHGVSTSVLAKEFNRNRPTIFRGIRILKQDMKHNKALHAEYVAIVEKIEGMAEATPSEDMKD